MTNQLNGVRVAFIVANEGIEEVELTEPWTAVLDAGGSPQLVAPKPGEVQAMNHLDKAGRFSVDGTTKEVRVDDFDAVVLPGDRRIGQQRAALGRDRMVGTCLH